MFRNFTPRWLRSSIPEGVWYLGFVTLFKNMSSMVFMIFIPLFLRNDLGVSMLALGTIEGLVDAIAFFSRIVSGILSDIIRKRKLLILIGYLLAFASRVLLICTGSLYGVFFSRIFDRLGNGIQASPREALVGDYSSPHNRGACFGLRQSLTVTGSFLGSILAMLLMWSCNSHNTIFWVALFPTVIALVLLVVLVKEPVRSPSTHSTQGQKSTLQQAFQDLADLPSSCWALVALSFIFMLSNYGLSFLIIAAQDTGMNEILIPGLMMVQSYITTLAAYPFGKLSDTFDRRWILAIGFITLIIADIILACDQNFLSILIGVALWGLQLGITQTTLLAFIAEVCPGNLRGTAYGTFYFMNGISVFLANSMVGYIWDTFSQSMAFVASSMLVGLALFALPFLAPVPKSLGKKG